MMNYGRKKLIIIFFFIYASILNENFVISHEFTVKMQLQMGNSPSDYISKAFKDEITCMRSLRCS